MMLSQVTGQPSKNDAHFGETPEVFSEIYQNDVCLTVWQRTLSPSINSECQTLINSKALLSERRILTLQQSKDLTAFIPSLTEFPYLRGDIQLLIEMFCCLFELDAVGLRLSTLSQQMCPRFHVDHVPCRLITTYVGVATDWLADQQADRSKLGRGSQGLPDDQSGLYQSENDISQLCAGDVALLKGETWFDNAGAGAIHRSPPMLPNSKRLLLTLDFAN